MNRYEVIILDPAGGEFARFAVHADTRVQAREQAEQAFKVMHRDKQISNYKVEIRLEIEPGKRH
jgi:hypothetical protein